MAKTADNFTGDKKEPLVSPLAALEKRFVEANVDRFPRWVETQHLTLLTLLWSALLLFAAWQASLGSRHWLWLSSLMLALQWFTDCFDGAIGRRRNAGLRRWGFYMDHFLDYVFMACVCGQYAFLVDGAARIWFLLLVPTYAAFEVNSWLEYGATGKFRITYHGFGPTEIRLFYILVNTAIIVAGTQWLAWVAPWLVLLQLPVLAWTVYGTQQRIWAQDMAEKAEAEGRKP